MAAWQLCQCQNCCKPNVMRRLFFCDMIRHTIEREGPYLELVVAWDEAVPGNVLAPDLTRKAAMTYGTIAHLPVPWASESWWSMCIARTHYLQTCSLGYPSSMSKFLHHVVSETKDGFTLMLGNIAHLCFFQKISLIADTDGLRFPIDWLRQKIV